MFIPLYILIGTILGLGLLIYGWHTGEKTSDCFMVGIAGAIFWPACVVGYLIALLVQRFHRWCLRMDKRRNV
jgi:hypothetical protein